MHLESLTSSISILNLEVPRQLIIYKKCMREAAKRVRNECLFLDSSGGESTKLILSSVSRALWFNNISLAKKLLNSSSIASDPIFVDGGKVCAHSYENFENTFGDFFKVYHRSEVVRLQQDLQVTTAATIKKQIKSRLQCARRMQGFFWPSGKRLKLSGIKTADGDTVTSAAAVQQELITHWGPIYQKKPIDLSAAQTLLGTYGRRHKALIKEFTKCSLPDNEGFSNYKESQR